MVNVIKEIEVTGNRDDRADRLVKLKSRLNIVRAFGIALFLFGVGMSIVNLLMLPSRVTVSTRDNVKVATYKGPDGQWIQIDHDKYEQRNTLMVIGMILASLGIVVIILQSYIRKWAKCTTRY